MTTAYVISRNVIIKALLPHRDTISTMIVSPRLSRRNSTFSRKKNACRKSQKQANSRFSLRYVLSDQSEFER
jgi:glutathionyl-hydroquinone reductase